MRKAFLIFLILIFTFPMSIAYAQSPGNVYQTEHFNFYFETPLSPQDQTEIANFYEGAVQKLEKGFSSHFTEKINIHINPKGQSYANPNLNEAFQAYDPSFPLYKFICHESLHIILPNILGENSEWTRFFHIKCPGERVELPELAVTAFDLYFAQPPRPVHKVVAVYLKEKDLTLKAILQEPEKYTVLEELLPWNSFFVHLLENYPWEAFQKFWNFSPDIKKDLIENVEEAFYQAYGKSFSELEKEWRYRLEGGRNRLEGIPFEREWIETVESIDEIVDLNRKIQAEREEFSSSGVQIKYADFPQLRVDVREFGPYAVPIEPSRNLEGLQNKRTELRE